MLRDVVRFENFFGYSSGREAARGPAGGVLEGLLEDVGDVDAGWDLRVEIYLLTEHVHAHAGAVLGSPQELEHGSARNNVRLEAARYLGAPVRRVRRFNDVVRVKRNGLVLGVRDDWPLAARRPHGPFVGEQHVSARAVFKVRRRERDRDRDHPACPRRSEAGGNEPADVWWRLNGAGGGGRIGAFV
ncbi:JM15 [macacine gammaherpesvirus 11]|uniref:JM15 n=2 Tax=macacine gammaherpesvirus 11 TaxID=2560570 RepID=G9JM23_9GAMA|nr:JM15 [Macaca fuscata rhadinovirus]AAS99992.1 JM15 [Macaca fuscata rhadinovirus]AEW87540.1 JM15 [Macaca fuscata rhadinovirus]AEW87710.1 JM15 [Macaca fuscata rhadinovirus]